MQHANLRFYIYMYIYVYIYIVSAHGTPIIHFLNDFKLSYFSYMEHFPGMCVFLLQSQSPFSPPYGAELFLLVRLEVMIGKKLVKTKM